MDIRLLSYIANGGEAGRSLKEIEEFFESKRNRPTSLDIQTSLNTMMNRQAISVEEGKYIMKEITPRRRKEVKFESKFDARSPPNRSSPGTEVHDIKPIQIEAEEHPMTKERPIYTLADHIRLFGQNHKIELLPRK